MMLNRIGNSLSRFITSESGYVVGKEGFFTPWAASLLAGAGVFLAASSAEASHCYNGTGYRAGCVTGQWRCDTCWDGSEEPVWRQYVHDWRGVCVSSYESCCGCPPPPPPP